MDEKIRTNRWGTRNKVIISSLLFIFLIAIIIFFLSAKPSGNILYVTANGSGDFNCDGIDDQVEINKALAYVAENPQYYNRSFERQYYIRNFRQYSYWKQYNSGRRFHSCA